MLKLLEENPSIEYSIQRNNETRMISFFYLPSTFAFTLIPASKVLNPTFENEKEKIVQKFKLIKLIWNWSLHHITQQAASQCTF